MTRRKGKMNTDGIFLKYHFVLFVCFVLLLEDIAREGVSMSIAAKQYGPSVSKTESAVTK